jgi:predicted phosphodiesterase
VRVAALYDVHGNVPALEAVLEEVEREQPDAIVFGGDIVAGPMPRETLEKVLAVESAVCIRGNADRLGVEFRRGRHETPRGLSAALVADELTDDQIEFLAGLPLTVTLDVEGLGSVCFCHATPRDDEEIFTERTPDGVVSAMLEGTEEPTVVCGHTHMQVDRRVGRWRVVNAGSVGLAYGGFGAHWALLGPDVELRRTEYDREGAARRMRKSLRSPSEDLERMIEHLLRPPSRDETVSFFEDMAAKQRGA